MVMDHLSRNGNEDVQVSDVISGAVSFSMDWLTGALMFADGSRHCLGAIPGEHVTPVTMNTEASSADTIGVIGTLTTKRVTGLPQLGGNRLRS